MKGEPKKVSVRWRMLCSGGGIFFGLRVESKEYLFVLDIIIDFAAMP